MENENNTPIGDRHTEEIPKLPERRVLGLSGGATKCAGVAGAAVVSLRDKGFKPTDIVGVSCGSIIALLLAMGMYDETLQRSRELTLRKIFTVSPVTKNGGVSFRGILRLLFGLFLSLFGFKKRIVGLGKQNVTPLLADIITPEIFEQYQNGDYPNVWVMAVEWKSNKPYLWNLKDKSITWPMAMAYIRASSKVPVAVDPEIIGGQMFYDGGLIDHNASHRLIKIFDESKYYGETTEWVSIYSRPYNFEVPPMEEPENIVDAALGTIEKLNMEVSKNDEQNEIEYVELKRANGGTIKYQRFNTPYILSSLYDVDNERLQRLQNESMDIVRDTWDWDKPMRE